MIQIIYLEEKILTRSAYTYLFEKQEGCKVVYSETNANAFIHYIEEQKLPADICILSDAYSYVELVKIIKALKRKSNHSYILLKSENKYMHGICLLLKNGLNGFFFTDQSLIDLKQVFYERTKYKITADKLKLILRNKKAPIEIKQLSCEQVSLSLNEIEFIQACVRDETYEEIALRMQKNVKTINGYRDSVFKKLQVKQRTAMVLAALRRNLIDL